MPPSAPDPVLVAAAPLPPCRPGAWDWAVARRGGYAWWYFDALTDEGDGLSCILFIGSVFSPSYALSARRGRPHLPAEHTAVNLSLYRRHRKVAWVMSEYPAPVEATPEPTPARLGIGASTMVREPGGTLRIAIDERAMPFRGRVAGEIVVEPLAAAWPEHLIARPLAGSPGGATHAWQAMMPRARLRARFTHPDFTLDAPGYHDRNCGDDRLERTFRRWGWARGSDARRMAIAYAFTDRDGTRRSVLLRDSGPGTTPDIDEGPAPPEGPLRRTRWGMTLPRSWSGGVPERFRCEPGALVEQAPFYARYRARLDDAGAGGGPLDGVGEYIDFDRFDSAGRLFLLRWLTRPMWRAPLI